MEANTANSYRDLMRLISRICCNSGGAEWTSIYSAIQSCVNPPHGAKKDGIPSGIPHGTKREDRTSGKSPAGSGSVEIFRYNMALKEHCEQQGEIVRYEEECLRAYPPQFRAMVHMQGFSFSGTGSSKKMARHHACREACVGMGIEL